ncbi:MAG TPA: hypothetical protein VF136_11355 [Methylomirabilota bacterium]
MSGAGAQVLRDARGRRTGERDRYGAPVASLTWGDDGRLAAAAVRVPDGSWLSIEPRATHDPRWGVSDLLRHGGAPVTHAAAIDWERVEVIPPLAEPARLPPGGGTAVLNLVAALADDQRCASLAYRGPYPTEQLFLALLESFHPRPGETSPGPPDPDLLAAFMASGLRWSPAPHARAFAPGGVYVQSRERIEKLAWRGRTYYRPDWHDVQRHTTHRVHDVGRHVHGSLWALDAALEDHLVLAPDGRVLAAGLPAPEAGPRRPLAAPLMAGVVAVVVAASAPPLAASIRAVAAPLALEWAPLSGEIAVLGQDRVEISTRLGRALAARLAATTARVEQVRLGFAAVAELGLALGDALRARAQARLAAATEADQAAALGAPRTAAAAGAREIGLAVEALLEDVGQLRA